MKYHAGRVVEGGFFLDAATWEIQTMPKGGGYLPGGKEKTYFKIPLPLIALGTPLAGLAYAVILPAVTCFGFVYLLAGRGARKLTTWRKDAVPI